MLAVPQKINARESIAKDKKKLSEFQLQQSM